MDCHHFFAFATLGEMSLKDVLAECHNQGWMPLVIARPKDPAGHTLIPCFTTRDVAFKFVARNLSKKHLFGTATLGMAELVKMRNEWLGQRGWRFELLDHPRRITNTHIIDVEVFESCDKPDVYTWHSKHSSDIRMLAKAD